MRLNITHFATEQNFDWVYILELDDSGFQSVLQKLSGNLSQVACSPYPQSNLVAVIKAHLLNRHLASHIDSSAFGVEASM